ncbi:alpha/beta fold hydrolase [Effusibacillus lacus]|uniref:2-succinyl-6-hydroxy-2,4-cyclohexadiene-1-carboxylate synthase n=1 Tax=Effusibacillus lacus TaxID=1348429 RepID=A0A292YFU2_9BACL|nr:alpha/beta hydrolase [Effusibacillus lacus]TCS75104.1 pimeloyl-ACP methyl ester carboxylesterase [Effusibacillus lacus]GAX89057.1 2-succinyl-6-hydroxy-2,4-cyclohexadiene-1-carboxylate synthase [Effusibacillus lacus]
MLHYKTYELGKTHDWVIFVHGAGGSSAIWYKQIRQFKEHFNILLLDLRGHGKSKNVKRKLSRYSFHEVSKDVIEVLDHLKIKSAHFVGISLGTIVIQTLAELCPERIRSMILGGAVTKLNVRSQILIALGNMTKHIIPYMWLYRLFAWVIMPRKNHRKSRLLFVNEAKKLCQKEFKRWFKLTLNINPFLRNLREKELPIPTLYLMGEEDYMFLPTVEAIVERKRFSKLVLIRNSGHVCNVDQPEEFNRQSIKFIKENLIFRPAIV